MKVVDKIITSIEPVNIEFIGARLLTEEEARALPRRLRLYRNWWWTLSTYPLDSYYAYCVSGDSSDVHLDVVRDTNMARPALIFELSSLKIGDRFIVADLEFEVIKESLAFCTTDIGMHAFRKDWNAEDANQYEKSDIKKYIDKWFEEAVK